MQTILGAGGAIGTGLARELQKYDSHVRLVGRNPVAVNQPDELYKADLTDPTQVDDAVKGSSVAYLTVGLKYDIKVWKAMWPQLMRNVVEACIKHDTKLVFFDNVYMYGKVDGWMTEETPYNPCSKKGEVRAEVARILEDEVEAGNLTALIARAADFYGPNAPNSLPKQLIFDKMGKSKQPQWLGEPDCKHSFTFTPDAIRATAELGNADDVWNQTWHLPTCQPVVTGRDFINICASTYKMDGKFSTISKGMLKFGKIFMPVLGELVEMYYQNDSDYLFDSSKFEKRFFKATTYRDGVHQIVGGR